MLDTQVNGVAALSATFLFLTTATLLLRFLARYRQKNSILLDDLMAAVAWLGFVGLAAVSFYGITHGITGHRQPKDKKVVVAEHVLLEQISISINALGIWTFGTAKISALFFYRRIFCTTAARNVFHWTTIVFIAIVSGWIVTFFVMTFLLCGNHSLEWSMQPGHSALCKLTYPYFEAVVISDFILDILILCLPIPKIWSLNTTTNRKIAVSCVFLLALVGLGASTARLVIYIHIINTGRAINDKDGYQTNTQAAYYAILEAGFTIVAVNLPSLWYFVAGASPESIMRRVRSLVSLSSGRSFQASDNGSTISTFGRKRSTTPGTSVDSGSSRSNLRKPHIETYALADLQAVTNRNQVIHADPKFGRIEEQV